MTNTVTYNDCGNQYDEYTGQDYSEHTSHYKKADRYSYNYKPTDAVLVDNYKDTTALELADMMCEPVNRLRYRAAKLIKGGVISNKYDVSETAKELRRLRAELKTDKAQLKATRPSLDKVA